MIKKLVLLTFLMLGALSARAQLVTPTLILAADPTGACPNGRFAVNIVDQTMFYCSGSVWKLVTSSGVSGTILPAQLPSFLTGTTGTDFNIEVNVNDVTFNIPDAGCTIRGFVNNTAQIFCGNKSFQGDIVIEGDLYNQGFFSTDHPLEITIADTCVASEANVALLCINPDDNKLYLSADGADPVAVGTGGGTTTTIIGNGLISGGGITWTGNLDFTVAVAEYLIAGNSYTSVQTDLTLTAADATNPRIDIFVVQDDGTVDFVTGTPAATPAKPSYDPTSQFEIGFAYIAALATTPANFSNVDLYLENTEWTCAVSANFDCASTSNPFAGTKDVKGTSAVSGNYFTLTKPAAGTENLASYVTLSARVRTDVAWPNAKSIVITALNGSTQIGVPVTLDNGTFGFNHSTLSSYQIVVIPVALFSTGNSLITTFKFTVAGGGAALSAVYFDNIFLQGGANGGATNTLRFADNIVPSGAINSSNQVYTLPQVPSPTTSLSCAGNGVRFQTPGDYTLSLNTITTVGTFQTGDTGLVCNYRY